MAQLRVNGAVAEGQLLVGSLSHFIINEVDGTDDISSFGFTAGAADILRRARGKKKELN